MDIALFNFKRSIILIFIKILGSENPFQSVPDFWWPKIWSGPNIPYFDHMKMQNLHIFLIRVKDECVDINECETDCNRKGQECINTIGSYICNCQPGFRLDDFGKLEFTHA